MPADLGSLHRILKDPTRRRILSALNEKGPLAYVEILGLLEIEHTGKLNYHLKLLGDLVSKDDSGRYSLTEKGKLAIQVTSKFQRVSIQENPATLHVGKIGLGKLFLVLSIPLFILSFIPLSPDYRLASNLSVLFGVVTVMFLVFGMVFIFPRSQSNDHLSLLQALGYGVLKAAIGATGLLWVGGLVLAGIVSFPLGAAPGFLGVYRLVVGNSLLVTLFLFVGIIAIEGAYRLIGWKGHSGL